MSERKKGHARKREFQREKERKNKKRRTIVDIIVVAVKVWLVAGKRQDISHLGRIPVLPRDGEKEKQKKGNKFEEKSVVVSFFNKTTEKKEKEGKKGGTHGVVSALPRGLLFLDGCCGIFHGGETWEEGCEQDAATTRRPAGGPKGGMPKR
jgi:hypothetical protein